MHYLLPPDHRQPFIYANLSCQLLLTSSATSGDVDAINKVLKHYAGYIMALSTRRLYDEYGNPHLFVDDELRRELETRLIARILTFNVA